MHTQSKSRSSKNIESLDTLSDEELFLRVQEHNDIEAYTEIYQRYHRRIFQYCRVFLQNTEAAQDAFQDIALKIYTSRETFTLDGKDKPFARWILRITRNHCLSLMRHEEPVLSFDEAVFSPLPEEIDDTIHQLRLRGLEDGIVHLAPDFREVIILRHYSKLTYAEISDLIGISISLAKIRRFRAIDMLAQHITQYVELHLKNQAQRENNSSSNTLSSSFRFSDDAP